MEQRLVFPQAAGRFIFSRPSARSLPSGTRDMLLLCGGRAPSGNWLREVSRGRELHCADSGADICREENLLPGSFVGDGDSVSPKTLTWLHEQGVPCEILPREKDETDYQVLLRRMASLGESVRSLVVTGIWGGRFDHLYSALFTSAGFLGSYELPLFGFADSREILFFLCSGEFLELHFSRIPRTISLMPLSEECRGVTSCGTRWDLENVVLRKEFPYAISNEISPEGEICTVRVEKGILGVYAWWG